MSFDTLGLDEVLVRALRDASYETPTEVQSRAIPAALAGRDLRVCSSTGSGKTAAFVLPALMKVIAGRKDPAQKPQRGEIRGPKILVLVPTRELAMQVAKAAADYGRHVAGLRVACVVGGVPYPAQLQALRSPLDILIATPGRLIDHLGSGRAVLKNVETLVLDEADRMLDMGFIEDIEHIAESLPQNRQTLMASATFAGAVGQLAARLQTADVERIEIAAHTDTHESISQELMWADSLDHKNKLLDHLLTDKDVDQAVVFTSTQRDADWLADRLYEMGHACASLHGGMPQGRRTRVLNGLRSRQLRVLIATDVAARGIDVPTISHVINYGLPLKAEDYVHRIGRTGRAGRSGRAITLAERRDLPMIRRIQHYTTQPIPVLTVVGLEPRGPAPDTSVRPVRAGAPRGKPFGRGGDYAGGNSGYQGRPRFGNDRNSDRAPQHEQPRTPFERPAAGNGAGGYFERKAEAQRGFQGERSGGDRGGDRSFDHGHDRSFDRAPAPPYSAPGHHKPSHGRPVNAAAPRYEGKPSASTKPRFNSNGPSFGKRPR